MWQQSLAAKFSHKQHSAIEAAPPEGRLIAFRGVTGVGICKVPMLAELL